MYRKDWKRIPSRCTWRGRELAALHWMCNALSYVTKTQQSMVAATLRQALSQPDRATAS